jgi:uncharacterized protein
MKIIIAGGSGFVGKALSRQLLENGHQVITLSRSPHGRKEYAADAAGIVLWDGVSPDGWLEHMTDTDAIVNLAGKNISAERWTARTRQEILESRINAGKALAVALERAPERPRVLIQASAIGYYGSRGDETLDESSAPGRGFLSEVCQKWEESTKPAESLSIRRVLVRTAMVLGKSGGALEKMVTPFRMCAGGPLGTGKQWLSWIHLEDEVRALIFLIQNDHLSGVFNLSSPESQRMEEVSKAIGRSMGRSSWLPVPEFALKLALGEMAEEMLLASARALPKRLLEARFSFTFPDLKSALDNLLGKD